MVEVGLAGDAEMGEVAQFFATRIALDPAYISHGEVQTGLSADGQHWVPDLTERMTEDFADRGPDRAIAVARIDGTLVGALVALTVQSERIDYLVIEDLVVDPAYRAHGIGAKLVSWAEDRARAAGISWLFLESGLHNEGAHAFFEKHGFHPMSKVFSKRV